MKMKMMLVLALMVVVASGAFAATANFWMTASGGSAAITTATIGGIGSTLALDMWYSCDVTQTSVAGFFAWDSSLTGSATGAAVGGAPTQNKLSAGIATIAIADLNQLAKNWVTATKGGTAPYAYGNFFTGSMATGTSLAATTGRKLMSVTLTNTGLVAGASFDTYLYKTIQVPALGCVVTSGSTKIPPTWSTSKVTITAEGVVPEPSSILALASGMIGIAGFAIRRRSA